MPDSRVCNITLIIMATQAVIPVALRRKYLVAQHANRGSDPRWAFRWYCLLLISLIFLDPQRQFDQVTRCNEQAAGLSPILSVFQEHAVRWPGHDHRSLIIRAVACALNESLLWGPGAS